MAWSSPTGHNDPDTNWNDEVKGYNDNTGDNAWGDSISGPAWGSFLELTIGELSCSQLRFWAYYGPPWIDEVDLDVYYDGGWHDVYQGTFASAEWVEKNIAGGPKDVTAARIKFHMPYENGAQAAGYLYDFDFGAGAAHEKSLSDTVAIADSISKGVGVNKADSVALADSFGKESEFYLAPTDTVAIADVLSKAMSIPLGDSVAIVDAILVSKGWNIYLTDEVAIADAISKATGKTLADSVAIADVIILLRNIVAVRTLRFGRILPAVRNLPSERTRPPE